MTNELRYQFFIRCTHCKAWEHKIVANPNDADGIQLDQHNRNCPVLSVPQRLTWMLKQASYTRDSKHGYGIDNSPCPIYNYTVPEAVFQAVREELGKAA